MVNTNLSLPQLSFRGKCFENMHQYVDKKDTPFEKALSKEEMKAFEQGRKDGIYDDDFGKSVDEFRSNLIKSVEKEAPKDDVVTFNVNATKNKDLEPLGVTVSYYSPVLDKGKPDKDIPDIAQCGLKELLENDSFGIALKHKIEESKEATDKKEAEKPKKKFWGIF
jgi:hypothetical protein